MAIYDDGIRKRLVQLDITYFLLCCDIFYDARIFDRSLKGKAIGFFTQGWNGD
jgi:hypothetical protein